MLNQLTPTSSSTVSSTAKSGPTATNLKALTEALLAEWQTVHGVVIGKASPMAGDNSFAVLIEDTFTRAEMALAKQPKGNELLQRYIEQLLRQVGVQLAAKVTTVLHRQVQSTTISPNPRGGWIICLFKLGDPLPQKSQNFSENADP